MYSFWKRIQKKNNYVCNMFWLECRLGVVPANQDQERPMREPIPDQGVGTQLFLLWNIAGVLRGNTIRGNTTRNSERKMALWEGGVSERAFEKPLKTSKNLSNPLKTSETLPLRDPLRDPLRGGFPSQNLSILFPLIILPLETPTGKTRRIHKNRPVSQKQPILVGKKKAHKLWTHKLFESRDNPPVNHREKLIFPVFRGEHKNFLARLTLGQPAICPRAIWTLTRAKNLCLCAFSLPETLVVKGAQTMKCRLWTETLIFWLKVPKPLLNYGLCSIFASNSRFVRLLQAPLDTCLNSPLLASLSVHGLQFTVYAASRWTWWHVSP